MDDVKSPPSIEDISQLDRQFCEKLYELQNSRDILQTMQKELLEARLALYNTELELEKERTVSHELRMQLKAAMDAVNELQRYHTKNQVESVQLQVKYDAMTKQYDSLMSQVTGARIHEREYKVKMQSLEEDLRQKGASNKKLERTLKQLEHDSSRTVTAIDHKIAKLVQEHQRLQKSCEEAVNFNQRLQTVGLCAHVIHQKDKAKIKELTHILASMSVRNAESAGTIVNHDVDS